MEISVKIEFKINIWNWKLCIAGAKNKQVVWSKVQYQYYMIHESKWSIRKESKCWWCVKSVLEPLADVVVIVDISQLLFKLWHCYTDVIGTDFIFYIEISRSIIADGVMLLLCMTDKHTTHIFDTLYNLFPYKVDMSNICLGA